MSHDAIVRSLRLHGKAPRTATLYAGSIRRLDAWLREHRPDESLQRPSPDALMDYGETLPLSYSSRSTLICAYLAYWRHHLGRADDGCPVWAVRCPPRPRPSYRGLPHADDARRLIEAAGTWGARATTACALLYYAGLRCSEAAHLRRRDDRGQWLQVMGKGDKQRRVPVHEHLRAHLDRYAASLNGSPYWFPGRRGATVSPNTIREWVALAGAAAGLGHVTPHQLRATCGATMLDETGDLKGVAEFLGHSPKSLDVTATVYTRTLETRLRGLMQTL